MKKLLILSGKGGTGKTTTAAAFVKFANAVAIADCDVDAPNLHIVTKMNDEPINMDFYGSDKASIDTDKCSGCGKCYEKCRFDAIISKGDRYTVNEFACEGCAVCSLVCPQNAVKMTEDKAGELTLYAGKKVFSTAKLKMGRGNSGKLVSEVKGLMQQATKLTQLKQEKESVAIIDGSPGIGCPVIASISGVDMALIVTEPSLSGLSDLMRIVKTASILQTRVAVCINRYDQAPKKAEMIQKFCEDYDIPFVGKIPYDKQASIAINKGISLADISCEATSALKKVFDATMKLLELE